MLVGYAVFRPMIKSRSSNRSLDSAAAEIFEDKISAVARGQIGQDLEMLREGDTSSSGVDRLAQVKNWSIRRSLHKQGFSSRASPTPSTPARLLAVLFHSWPAG